MSTEDKIEYLTNQNEFLKNANRKLVEKNKVLEEEFEKLLEENNNLKKMIQSMQSSTSLNNNVDTELYDLFLFLAGGVLIISLLEILVKIK